MPNILPKISQQLSKNQGNGTLEALFAKVLEDFIGLFFSNRLNGSSHFGLRVRSNIFHCERSVLLDQKKRSPIGLLCAALTPSLE